MKLFGAGTAVLPVAVLLSITACQNLPEPKAGFAKSSAGDASASKPPTGQTPRTSGVTTGSADQPPARTVEVGTGGVGSVKYDPSTRKRVPPAPEYTEDYKRDPNRPSPAEARKQAERDFNKMVTPRVLRMLALLNAERKKNGLSTVVLEPRLMAAALRESRDMAKHGHVSHTGSDGSHMEDRIADVQYYYTKIAENIAAGKPTAKATFQQWVTSKNHYEQMMITGATQVGIAYAYNPNPPRGRPRLRYYWTLLIGRPHPFLD